MNPLKKYGASERFIQEATLYPDEILARVTAQHRQLYQIATQKGKGLAEVSGKFKHEADSPSNYPVVGDFVMVDRDHTEAGNAVIHHVLRRKSAFERTAAGSKGHTQIVAANIDFVFICMALNQDYNLSRMERYLAAAWNSGATPVVVLTKADLCKDVNAKKAEVSTVALGADILAVSSLNPESCSELLAYIKPGVTTSFIGSSGVGKSTLVNCLSGENLLTTAPIREDDGKGRHTTTHRELIVLPQGGIIIDTPGMRELGVDSADLSKGFSDIDALAGQCRFHDCTHTSEPGCAIKAALMDGTLDERRLENYRKLQKESRYEGLSAKQIEAEKIYAMFGGMGGMKKARDFVKNKGKNR